MILLHDLFSLSFLFLRLNLSSLFLSLRKDCPALSQMPGCILGQTNKNWVGGKAVMAGGRNNDWLQRVSGGKAQVAQGVSELS